jgi:acetylglutamate kinase
MDPAEVVLRFLESVGRPSEAEFYLNLFRSEPKEQFAAISVDANVARHATEAVVLHLRFLAGLGLFPTVVIGLFEPTDAQDHAARIQRRLGRADVPAELIPAGTPDLDARVIKTAQAGVVPIIAWSVAEGATAEDRFARLAALLTQLRTRKLLFLHRPGGLRQQGSLVPVVNLNTDFASLMSSRELSRKERALLTQSRSLVLEKVPQKLVVAITSPLNVLRELFTIKGAGTLLRPGAVIQQKDSFDQVDRERLKALLTSAFGRVPYDSFFERPILRIYLEENYRGAAIVQKTPLGPYLSKFAVGKEAQGEGLGRDLWDAMMSDIPSVFWRARPSNSINEWYTKLCDGLYRNKDWTVFWKGIGVEYMPSAIAYALGQPVDLPPVQAPAA